MNKRQKEAQQQHLNNEKDVIQELKSTYKEALEDINDKINMLMARQDADMQHVIYQIEYQQALKGQVETILGQMQTNQFTSVSEYLTKCYEDGFISTMYDLQGQGIPLVMPIDQKQVATAMQHETKLSENLYTALGKDVKTLQKQISSEISRGISTGLSFSDMARNISSYAGISRNKAMRIARTEGHRISCQATSDAQQKAKDKGADIVKQWDATLDDRTRPTHMKLNGQIRELDEPFEVDGMEAMEPGGFGIASEDINCRCALCSKARWMLSEDETKYLGDVEEMSEDRREDIAEKLGIPADELENYSKQVVPLKAKDYTDFKEQYSRIWNYDNQGKTIANNDESSKININKYIGKKIITTDNKSVRQWYYSNVHDIPNQIDKTKNYEDQAYQAFNLRNKYKHEARVAMSDAKTVKMLEEKRPAPTFESLLIDKMDRKNMSKKEALEDILKTASKTNVKVDSEFGLGGD